MTIIRRGMLWMPLGVCLASLVLQSVGCGPPPISKVEVVPIAGYDQEIAKRIQLEPIVFLDESLAETRKLDQYTTDFCRQERLGVLNQLRPMEHIRAEYRADPLSIRFTWQDRDSEFRQCAYVEGTNEDKVALLPRAGVLGLPPSIERYPPTWAVLFSKSKFPLTDFGPRRLMEKTLDRIRKAEPFGKVRITLKEPAEIGPAKEPCFHLEIRYPQGDQFQTKLQDLYIHTQTRLPVATFLWLPGKEERCSETLDAMYQYANLRSDAELSDADFRIDLKAVKKPAKPGNRAIIDEGGQEESPAPAALTAQPEN
ncbi:MAG TPA: DUF1571 domain-containing protein [Phycisphaerae bacterium]|nr:DUF1571 domain-containing protein [Phycisphaerae bacterium]